MPTTNERIQGMAAVAGLPVPELVRRFRIARWVRETLEYRVAGEDWPATLEKETAAIQDSWRREDEQACESALCDGGARFFASKTTDELLELAKDRKLRDFGAKHSCTDHGGALLVGPTGNGKSAACAALVQRETRRLRDEPRESELKRLGWVNAGGYRPVMWASAAALARAVTEHPLGKGSPEIVLNARHAPVLIIDDLTWASRPEVIVELLGFRYDAALPTVANAGVPVEELFAKFGEAVIRRILETPVKGRLVDCFKKVASK